MAVEREYIHNLVDKLTPEESQMVLQLVEFLVQQREKGLGAHAAKRKVSAWLVREVGNLLMGDTPQYIHGEPPRWRVPVLVTVGRRGHAAYVDVDARSGELLVDEDTPERIKSRVQTFVADTTSS
jgi:hypothetical protein